MPWDTYQGSQTTTYLESRPIFFYSIYNFYGALPKKWILKLTVERPLLLKAKSSENCPSKLKNDILLKVCDHDCLSICDLLKGNKQLRKDHEDKL